MAVAARGRVLALAAGVREGELLGLTWRAIDLDCLLLEESGIAVEVLSTPCARGAQPDTLRSLQSLR